MQPNKIFLGYEGVVTELTAYGRTYSESWVEISRTDRTASGRLVQDITAKKKRFTLDYDLIPHTELEDIAEYYAFDDELQLIVNRPDDTQDTYTVIMRPFDQERARAKGAHWSGVSIEMEEV
jgi:hypothetical protein